MTATCPVSTVDSFLARLALSLWVSERRVEPLPVVRVWEPSQVVEIVSRPFGETWGGLYPPARGWEGI